MKIVILNYLEGIADYLQLIKNAAVHDDVKIFDALPIEQIAAVLRQERPDVVQIIRVGGWILTHDRTIADQFRQYIQSGGSKIPLVWMSSDLSVTLPEAIHKSGAAETSFGFQADRDFGFYKNMTQKFYPALQGNLTPGNIINTLKGILQRNQLDTVNLFTRKEFHPSRDNNVTH